MTGGVVEHNPIVATLLSARLGRQVHVLERAQLAGAHGAALRASGRGGKEKTDA